MQQEGSLTSIISVGCRWGHQDLQRPPCLVRTCFPYAAKSSGLMPCSRLDEDRMQSSWNSLKVQRSLRTSAFLSRFVLCLQMSWPGGKRWGPLPARSCLLDSTLRAPSFGATRAMWSSLVRALAFIPRSLQLLIIKAAMPGSADNRFSHELRL